MSKEFELGLARAAILVEIGSLKQSLKAIDDIPTSEIHDKDEGFGLFTISKKRVIEVYKEHEQELLERLKELDNEQSIQG